MDRRIRNAALAGTALAAAVGGTAVADQLLTSRDIKDGSIKLKDLARGVRDQLAEDGRKGEQGPQGTPGLQGETGAAGQGGPQGPRGISTLQLGGRMSSTADPSDLAFHGVIGGNGGGLISSGVGSESSVQIAAPQDAVSAGNLRIRQSPAPSDNLTFTLRVNGANTAVSCTVTTAQTACDSAAASAAVSPGDLLSLGVTAGTKTTVSAAFSLDLNLGT